MLFRAGVPRHAIIKKLAGQEISRIDDLITVLSKLSRGARVPLEYISHTDRYRSKVRDWMKMNFPNYCFFHFNPSHSVICFLKVLHALLYYMC